MKSISFFAILFFIALITACSKKTDDSSRVTPGSDSLTLTNTQLIARSWKYQTIDVILPDGMIVNLFTRGGIHNANVDNEYYNISLDKTGGFKAYLNSELIGSGNWVFTSNETKITFTGDANDAQTIIQLTYYHWDDKLIYDPVTTSSGYFVDEARSQKIDISKGATFIFKRVPN